jgi:hypothetical protein
VVRTGKPTGAEHPLGTGRWKNWRTLLRRLHLHARIPSACLRQVVDTLDPDGARLFSPPQYGPALPPPAQGCQACRPRPSGYRPGEEDHFPHSWTPISNRLSTGHWVQAPVWDQPVYCQACGTLRAIYLDPDSGRHRTEPLPAACSVSLGHEATPAALAAHLVTEDYRRGRAAGGRRWLWQYFERASYDRTDAAAALAGTLASPALTVDAALDGLELLRLVIVAASEDRAEAPDRTPDRIWTIDARILAVARTIPHRRDLHASLPPGPAGQARAEAERVLAAIDRASRPHFPL